MEMANDPVFGRKKGKVRNWVFTKNREGLRDIYRFSVVKKMSEKNIC
jgi:hypothetical protein